VEGVMKKALMLTLLIFIPIRMVEAKDRMVSVMYYNKIYGHIHKSASRYSQSLSTLECNHPVKVLSVNGQKSWGEGFSCVKVGPYKGYIHKDYLSSRKSKCFQDKYPRFFDKLNLSISDMYYWGKLYDQYIRGRSKVR
jgi:hypothetical protein